jgi:hypothetical protein
MTMKIAGVEGKKPDLIRDSTRKLYELAFNMKLEQSALHFARNEQKRRNRQAKKAAKAAQ